MSIAIKSFGFVVHPVSDIARARTFYEGWMGLKPGLQVEFAPGMWWIEYDVAGAVLAVSNSSPETTPRASNVALELADLDAALADARTSGIEIANDVMDFGKCRMFVVKDPDGNSIILHKLKG
jgi:predicted enzyme related to lactoylglutathione lyase